MTGGAELPLLWALVFLAGLGDAALRFASLSRLEDELDDSDARRRYAQYLEDVRSLSALCVLLRTGAATALVVLIVWRGGTTVGAAWLSALSAGALLLLAEWAARLTGRKWSAEALRVLMPVLHPLSWPLRILSPAARREPAEDETPEPEVVEAAKEEIRVAIEDGMAEGALEAEEKEMIKGIMKFGDVDVAEIMTPRTEMEFLEAGMPAAEAAPVLSGLHHSRIPIYEETPDRIVGICYVKDLLSAVTAEGPGRVTLRDVARDPVFVPETKTVSSLLQQFQNDHVQIAIVIDEYGGVVGLVTVEDIMEEIVGEIQDEYDQEDHENRVCRRSAEEFELDARVRIDEVNELLDVDIPEDEDYDTVGGYVTAHLARVPEPGEEFQSDGLTVRVLECDERRVHRVLLRREPSGGNG